MVLGQNIGDHVDKVKIFNIPKINPYLKGLSSTPKSHSQKSLRSIITPPPPNPPWLISHFGNYSDSQTKPNSLELNEKNPDASCLSQDRFWAAVWTAVVTAKKNPVTNDQIMTNGVSPDILRALSAVIMVSYCAVCACTESNSQCKDWRCIWSIKLP